MNMRVKWLAVKNTEREAIRKHGDVWLIIRTDDAVQKVCITPPDKSDLRWITTAQVKESLP